MGYQVIDIDLRTTTCLAFESIKTVAIRYDLDKETKIQLLNAVLEYRAIYGTVRGFSINKAPMIPVNEF